jgi:mannose-6-phosphate isomerase-like protein (cupin superfamily)
MSTAPEVRVDIAVGKASVRRLADQEEFRSICGFRRDLVGVGEGEQAVFHYMRIHDSRKHYHKRQWEYYFVADGAGEMDLDDQTIAIGKGDMIAVPPLTRHTTRPTGGGELHVLICVVPPPEPGADSDHFYD